MSERGTRPVRIANCSGAAADPGYQMLRQATGGPVDFITGDYLAEMNLAWNAEAYRKGQHPGYEPTAKDGLWQSLPTLDKKRIKVVINGGALNPKGLAQELCAEVKARGYNLTVSWVDGDDLIETLPQLIAENHLIHLDSSNTKVFVPPNAMGFLHKTVVSANAYLGARGIRTALENGADIVICGRVADASPVIGAAQWWFGWEDTQFNELAGSLLAGHLIECSAYVTGANFAEFYKYPQDTLINVGFPIVEIDSKGNSVITKHDNTNGMVNSDTVKCQLLYELQGNVYLNSDVKADLTDVVVEDIGKDRVQVTGVKGFPPPPTTKLAVFFNDGYQSEFTINATAYATKEKFDLAEAQLKHRLEALGVLGDFDVLEFQRIGVPEENPRSQLRGTTYMRVFAQAAKAETLYTLAKAYGDYGMQHFSGSHCSMDRRTMLPKPYQAYYPAIIEQSVLSERAHIFDPASNGTSKSYSTGHPPITEPMSPRDNYDPVSPTSLSSFGPTVLRPLGDIALARSGDKGANINIGIFVKSSKQWEWLRSYLTRDRMQQLMGDDWNTSFVLERVEFSRISAVHFVVYGPLVRGVSSSPLLDALGKGFADYIRAKWVEIPVQFLSTG